MQIRLVPIVLFAATSLLTLKAFDMLLSGEALLEGPKAAHASSTPAEGDKKEGEKKDAAKEGEKKDGEAAAAAPVRPTEHIVPAKGEASAETTLNEKLGEKRRELDTRTKELEMRESLVQAAEKKLDDQSAEKNATQAKAAQAGPQEDAASTQIKNLVVMYETMKPKEAAAIFNSLDMGVMIEVVQHMKPQITALILAKMSTPAAQKLTVEIAKRSSMMMQSGFAASTPASAPARETGPKELPRIDNAPKK